MESNFNYVLRIIGDYLGSRLRYFRYNPADDTATIGAASRATRQSEVSVGSDGRTRTVSHVTAGVEATDAVNVSQLRQLEGEVADMGAAVNLHSETINNHTEALADIGTYEQFVHEFNLAVGASSRFYEPEEAAPRPSSDEEEFDVPDDWDIW